MEIPKWVKTGYSCGPAQVVGLVVVPVTLVAGLVAMVAASLFSWINQCASGEDRNVKAENKTHLGKFAETVNKVGLFSLTVSLYSTIAMVPVCGTHLAGKAMNTISGM